MVRTRALLTLVLLLSLPSGCAAGASHLRTADGGYFVKLFRPTKVGTRWRVRSRATREQRTQVKLEGKVIQADDNTLTLVCGGIKTVEAVDARGRITRYRVAIETCQVEGPEDALPVIEPGKILRVDRNPPGSITLGDAPLDAAKVNVLNLVFATSELSEHTDQEMLGTEAPQQIGASWPVNGEAMAAVLKKDAGMAFEGERLEGQSTLEAAPMIQGVPFIDVSSQFEGKLAEFPGLPPGAKVHQGVLRAGGRQLLPLDPEAGQAPPSRDSQFLDIAAEVNAGSEGQQLEMLLVVSVKRESVIEPLP